MPLSLSCNCSTHGNSPTAFRLIPNLCGTLTGITMCQLVFELLHLSQQLLINLIFLSYAVHVHNSYVDYAGDL